MTIAFVPLAWDRDLQMLAATWRGLETDAEAPVFLSWSWVGCRVAERFDAPWLLRASAAGRIVGLALFNRTGGRWRRRFHLHETGRRDEDSVFIEHNGVLLARGHEALLRPMLAHAARRGRLVLSGVGEAVRVAANGLGVCRTTARRPAPYAELRGLDETGWLARLGSSTRYQLRRSWRAYAGAGRITLRRAASLAEALAFLDGLARLHQASWVARGRPGAFAEPAFVAFHRAFLAEAVPRGEAALLRITAGAPKDERVIGFLYNLCAHDRIHAYQSGFDYATGHPHRKPGLTCHHAAIQAALCAHYVCYDFLAGEARYKTDFASAEVDLHWLELARGIDGILMKARLALTGERLAWPTAALMILLLSALCWLAIGIGVYRLW